MSHSIPLLLPPHGALHLISVHCQLLQVRVRSFGYIRDRRHHHHLVLCTLTSCPRPVPSSSSQPTHPIRCHLLLCSNQRSSTPPSASSPRSFPHPGQMSSCSPSPYLVDDMGYPPFHTSDNILHTTHGVSQLEECVSHRCPTRSEFLSNTVLDVLDSKIWAIAPGPACMDDFHSPTSLSPSQRTLNLPLSTSSSSASCCLHIPSWPPSLPPPMYLSPVKADSYSPQSGKLAGLFSPRLASPSSSGGGDYVDSWFTDNGSLLSGGDSFMTSSSEEGEENRADGKLDGVGGFQSMEEEEEVAAIVHYSTRRALPARRSLELEDAPQSQFLLQSASVADQPISSVADSHFPSSSPLGLVHGVTSMRTQSSSLALGELPADGVSAPVGKSGQAQDSLAALWLTLPQLSDLVTQATHVESRARSGVLRPSILLGFHQSYPVVNGQSQVSFLVNWLAVESTTPHRPLLTLETPFRMSLGGVNPFSMTFQQQVAEASRLLEPRPCELHLVDVLFDMARINPALATILDHIPIMSVPQLTCYSREDIDLIPGRQHHYGRLGERKIGTGITVQLHVALLRVRGGIDCPTPPPEPVVFFTAHTSHIAHPILLPPPFMPNPLYSATQTGSGRYPHKQTSCSASLASVTMHHLTSVSNGSTHWHTATHNINLSESDVMTVFVTSTEPSTASSFPLVYRYLSNELNTLPSSTTYTSLREQNIVSG
jgi:hypothetical protein